MTGLITDTTAQSSPTDPFPGWLRVHECRVEAARELHRPLFDQSKEGVPSKKWPFTLHLPMPGDRGRVAAIDQCAGLGDR